MSKYRLGVIEDTQDREKFRFIIYTGVKTEVGELHVQGDSWNLDIGFMEGEFDDELVAFLRAEIPRAIRTGKAARQRHGLGRATPPPPFSFRHLTP